MRIIRHAIIIVACLAAGAACSSDTTADSPPTGASGKADDAGNACALSGTWTATGDWPSFEDWTFVLEGGALLLSETDDLPADDWATHLVRDAFDASALSLIQVTRAGDAVFQSSLNMRVAGCVDGRVELEVTEAYTVTVDLAEEDADSVERHEVVVIDVAPVDPPAAAVSAVTACPLTGAWTATGDWPSFGEWSFTLEDGALVSSETDDLSPDEWPTELLRDAFDASALSLVQITRAGDAILQSTLNLSVLDCGGGSGTLEVTEAYTITIDLAEEDADSVWRHAVTVAETKSD
ncbi:MAG: hypothetical protein ACI9MR_001758 [Myxococcota bacterium]|jgi:hypothetical protein